MADAGSKVGEAYIELRYKPADDAAAAAESGIEQDLNPRASRLGEKFGTVLGKGIGVALNPKVQAGVGAASALVLKFASDQQEAATALDAAITQSGKNVGDFTKQIDAAVKSSTRLGEDQGKVKDELAQLTLALGSPAKALAKLNEARDIAAGRNISFTSAVQLLTRAEQGQASAYAQAGIQVRDLSKAEGALNSARSAGTTATGRLRSAQDQYNDKLQIYRDTLKPTLTQQIALYRSHQALVDAQNKSAAAAGRVRAAQQGVRAATADSTRAAQLLADRYKGQGSAGADTFIGRLKKVGAEARNTAGDLTNKVGGAISQVGPLLFGLGTIAQATAGVFRALRTAQVVGAAEGAAAEVAASATVVGALNAETVAAARTAGALRIAAGAAAALGVALVNERLKGEDGDPNNPLTKLRNQRNAKNAAADAAAGVTPQDRANAGNRSLTSDANDAAGERAGARAAAVAGRATTVAAKKTGKDAGDQTLQQFLNSINGGGVASSGGGIGGSVAKQINAARQPAIDAIKKLMAGVRAEYNAANSKLKADISASRSLRDQIAGALTGSSSLSSFLSGSSPLTTNTIGDVASPNGGRSVRGLKSFLATQRTKLLKFARDLNDLRAKGLSPTLVAQVAELGPDDGDSVARELLRGSRSDLKDISTLDKQVNAAAGKAGQAVADAQYAKQIAADQKHTDLLHKDLVALGKKLDAANKVPRTLTVKTTKTGASARSIAREVTLASKGM